MLGATAAAFALSWLVTTQLGGDAATIRVGLLALAVASVATFAPAMLRIGKDHWGLAVLGCGVARALVLMAWCFAAVSMNAGLASRPLFLGAASAAMFLLVVETAMSIRILSSIDAHRNHA